jgi:hypothetical protein
VAVMVVVVVVVVVVVGGWGGAEGLGSRSFVRSRKNAKVRRNVSANK